MVKEITIEDYKNNKVSKEDFENLVNSFKNYLDYVDEISELNRKTPQGKDWDDDTLEKHYKKCLRNCKIVFNDDVMLVDDKGNISTLNSTRKYIFNLIPKIQNVILMKKKFKETER